MKSVMLSPTRTHKDDSRIGKNPNESSLFIRISAKEGLGRKETTVSEFLSNRWASTMALYLDLEVSFDMQLSTARARGNIMMRKLNK